MKILTFFAVPMATVMLTTPHDTSSLESGSSATLTCTATLPGYVDTEVKAVVAWDTPGGIVQESTEKYALSALHIGSHVYQFTLHISSLSE